MQQTAAIHQPSEQHARLGARQVPARRMTQGFELEGQCRADPGPPHLHRQRQLSAREGDDSFPNAGISVVNGVPTPVGATGTHARRLSPAGGSWAGGGELSPADRRAGRGARRRQRHPHLRLVIRTVGSTHAQGRVTPQSCMSTARSACDGRAATGPLFAGGAQHRQRSSHYQSITWGGTPNLWRGPVSSAAHVFFKIACSL